MPILRMGAEDCLQPTGVENKRMINPAVCWKPFRRGTSAPKEPLKALDLIRLAKKLEISHR